MKKHNYSLLVASLISTIALVACNSGSSSNNNPSPTPSPTIAPTTTPPSPVPPVTAESGAYVAGSGFTYTFSTAPSTGAWFQYSTVSTQVTDATGAAVATPAAFAVGVTPNGILTANGKFLFASANGAQFTQLTNNLTTPTTDTAVASTDALGGTGVTSIITGGTNTVIFTPTSAIGAQVNGQPAVNTPIDVTTQIVAVTPAGVVTQSPVFTNSNGLHTAPKIDTSSVIKNFGGTYYLYTQGVTTAAVDTVYTSTDGINWVYVAAPTAGLEAKSITQIGSTYYAIADHATAPLATVVSGTSPTAIATPTVLTSNGGTTNDINSAVILKHPTNLYTDGTSLYVAARTDNDINVKTVKLYYFGSGITQQASAQGDFAAAPNLLFAGSTVYDVEDETGATVIAQNGKVLAPTTQVAQVFSPKATTTTVQGSKLIVANPIIGGLDDGAPDNVGGGVDIISSVAANGTTSYQVLPIATTGAGFAGTPTNYMVVGANGSAILSSNGAFVPVASIQDTSVAGTTPQVAKIEPSSLVSNGASYVAIDTTGNLYVSNGVGADLTWTMLPVARIGVVTKVQTAGGTYFISTSKGEYQTSTPTNLASWVETSTPRSLNSSLTNFGGTYYSLSSDSSYNMNVYVFDITSGSWTTYANVLPQPYTDNGNIGYNGTTFALAQSSSANIWTSTSLTGGRSAWTSATATFATPAGVAISATFGLNPALIWTGATWLVNDSMNQLEFSSNGTVWKQSSINGNTIPAYNVTLF